MDFSKVKAKALELKNKAIELKNKAIESTAKKISESTLVLINQQNLEDFILKSENKKVTTPEWEEKIFTKRVFVIFWNSKENFFKEFMLSLPILITKAFSQNISFKVVDISNVSIDYSKYEIKEFPSILVFQNKEVYKLISGEEKFKKVVKSLTFDINKTIEEL